MFDWCPVLPWVKPQLLEWHCLKEKKKIFAPSVSNSLSELLTLESACRKWLHLTLLYSAVTFRCFMLAHIPSARFLCKTWQSTCTGIWRLVFFSSVNKKPRLRTQLFSAFWGIPNCLSVFLIELVSVSVNNLAHVDSFLLLLLLYQLLLFLI